MKWLGGGPWKRHTNNADKETSCHALKTGDREESWKSGVTRRRKPLSSSTFHLSTYPPGPTHTHARIPAPYVFIASSSSSIKRTTYDPLLLSNRFQQRGWWKCSWKGWVREKGGWGPLSNRHLDEARGREDQGGWRHATIIWVRTGYDPVAEPQTSFSRLHTHTQVLKNDAYKIGRGILSMEESRNFIVVPCRHGKWEIEFARFLWNAGLSLYSFAFLVSHASIIIGQCCHAI